MADFLSTMSTKLHAFSSRFHDRPVLTTILASSALLFPLAIRNYFLFLKLKPNLGLANPLVYIISLTLRLMIRDTLTTDEYDAPLEVKGSWLTPDFPFRTGDRPQIGWFPAPHRQVSQWATADMNKKICVMLREMATARPNTLEIRRSKHEFHTDGLFVARSLLEATSDPPNDACKTCYGEVAHVHDTLDFSLHVVLAPQDCKKVIQNGWGERHPCAGKLKGMPKEYLLIYTPRDEEELRTVTRIVSAAATFLLGEASAH